MKYFHYFNYVIRHKWFVGLACFKMGLFWQGIIHDWSKFLPSEFIPYARYFYGPKGDTSILRNRESRVKIKIDFDMAWLLHQRRNLHHWQYWVLLKDDGSFYPLVIPYHFRLEMLCDWKGAGRAQKGGLDNWNETFNWYCKNKDRMKIEHFTRKSIEMFLEDNADKKYLGIEK